ncbi:hypothetical protein HGM15179_011101 [Zosterops borbonicus]|uniref:Uncharacterized protein n=1 Tax=Zosterops borbonicus TaxID=364589 RepID=A0A8K1GD99_9PASS|nr:hypothetical protein HGM15179_011101 [Zosterops borbonicus]
MAEVAFAVTWGIPAEPSGRVISGIGKALPEGLKRRGFSPASIAMAQLLSPSSALSLTMALALQLLLTLLWTTPVVDVTVGVTVSALVQVVLDQVVGILSPHPPVMVTPCQALVQGSGGAGLSSKVLPLPLCWLCRRLVARAEAAVPVGSVAAAAAGLCRALPLPVAGACQCLAERYAALALEGLLGRLGPRLLCRLFLACRSGDDWDNEDVGTLPPPWVLEAIVVRLAECVSEEDPIGVGVPALSLPAGPCALGPIFWCSGPEAARRCQALQHCQEHVWL